MQLTEHFSLEELTATAHRGVDNTPPADAADALKATAEGLERVRRLLGHPIHVTSGYRSALLNRLVGGSKTSAHMKGWAADFVCPAYGAPQAVCQKIASSGIGFDQLISEGTWVHISFAPAMRRQVLTQSGGRYSKGL